MNDFLNQIMQDPLIRNVQGNKYSLHRAEDIQATRMRVAAAAFINDPDYLVDAQNAIIGNYLLPGGRIVAGAGTNRLVTLSNCFVGGIIQDHMPGIMRALSQSAYTLQQGGGEGSDFSTVRPAASLVKRTGSVSSGSIAYMKQRDASSDTICSAGERRGAEMTTLADDHPDLWNEDQYKTDTNWLGDTYLVNPSFISVKSQKGVLTHTNISVLISDAFMEAVKNNKDWDLGFHKPRADGNHVDVYDRPFPYDYVEEDNEGNIYPELGIKKGTMLPWFVYRRVLARRIWADLLRATYEYSEPGIIFIDEVNARNNLQYREAIRCTNPCFTGDTLVWTIDGPRRFDQIKDIPVLTELSDGQLAYRMMTNPRLTRRKAKLVEVLFKTWRGRPSDRRLSLTAVKVTPMHEFFLSDGTRKQARYLKPGDSIESAYRTKANQKGYMQVRSTSGDKVMEHHLVAEYDHGRRPQWPEEHGHHVNGKNDTRNIEILPSSQHNSEHMLGDNNPMRKWWDNATPKERIKYKIHMSLATSGTKNGRYRSEVSTETILELRSQKLSHAAIAKKLGCSKYMVMQRLGWERPNHTVVSVSPIVEREDVYCGTVKDTGRFFISLDDDHYEGVLVSNCGEQPLPPHASCNLASINLAQMVINPFTPIARIDIDRLRDTTAIAVRMLDNILDIMNYPLVKQREESMRTRRIGLGLTGMADALIQLGLHYGENKGRHAAGLMMWEIKNASYLASASLAEERGPFLDYNEEEFLKSPNLLSLSSNTFHMIESHGLRNGVLNTVAPNGTISIVSGNTGQGIEAIHSFDGMRKVRQPDGSFIDFQSVNYSYRLWKHLHKDTPLPDYFVTAEQLTPEQHIKMQAAVQEHTDASISKTVNCSSDMTFEDFQSVYDLAYELGCKGCTTYRPSSIRGSILTTKSEEIKPATNKEPRELILSGQTHKIKWPQDGKNWYVTINDQDGRPFEVFIETRESESREWVDAVGHLITAVLRSTPDPRFLVKELIGIHSPKGGAFVPYQEKYRASVVAAIGGALEMRFKELGLYDVFSISHRDVSTTAVVPVTVTRGMGLDSCPECGSTPLVHEQGCVRCLACSWTRC